VCRRPLPPRTAGSSAELSVPPGVDALEWLAALCETPTEIVVASQTLATDIVESAHPLAGPYPSPRVPGVTTTGRSFSADNTTRARCELAQMPTAVHLSRSSNRTAIQRPMRRHSSRAAARLPLDQRPRSRSSGGGRTYMHCYTLRTRGPRCTQPGGGTCDGAARRQPDYTFQCTSGDRRGRRAHAVHAPQASHEETLRSHGVQLREPVCEILLEGRIERGGCRSSSYNAWPSRVPGRQWRLQGQARQTRSGVEIVQPALPRGAAHQAAQLAGRGTRLTPEPLYFRLP